jgi:hypothetical protein
VAQSVRRGDRIPPDRADLGRTGVPVWGAGGRQPVAVIALAIARAQVRSVTASDELAFAYRFPAREAKSLLAHATAEGVAERTAGQSSPPWTGIPRGGLPRR